MQHKSQRVALITGGSRGIGAETALALADHGYDIAFTYRNKAARAQDEFAGRGVRLVVVTGDLIEGTITPKLLERTAPGLIDQRRTTKGTLPTAAEMGKEIVLAAMKTDLPSGSTVVVGAALQSMFF
jgi:NAD(P)-dependent dehydrogenase (short-subunit alcohol dehydrogenase family)